MLNMEDGRLEDARTLDSPEITVGAGGNGGPVAFEPSAILVSPETVVSNPDTQLGETDVSFSSGDPIADENYLYTELFDESGIVLYHCAPHLDLGMKGAVIVES